MTPSKLKEQLKVALYESPLDVGEALIDIILEQQAALDWCYDHWNSSKADIQEQGFDVTRDALAATAEKLKALGCEI